MTEILRWYLWLGVYIGVNGQPLQKFAIEPQNQTAIIGTKVSLSCRVVNKSGSQQWTKDDFGLGSHRNLSDYLRYSMPGTDDEGDFTLVIDPVTLEDDAKFQCQVGPGKRGEPGIRSKDAVLTVLVPPERPVIEQGTTLTTTEDREIELECVSKNGKPAADITWIDGLGNVVTHNAEYRTDPPVNKLTTARSILKITPKKHHHNTTFVCQASNAAERLYQSAKLQLYVKYAPKVKLKINGNQFVEGMDVKIICSVEANPPATQFHWYLNDNLVKSDSPTELLLKNISREQHESIVKCEATNTVGKSEDSETLHVVYGPRFTKRPESVQAEANIPITLFCEVEGNPMPEISWIHEKYEKKVVSTKSTNLTIRVSEETTGKYYCKAVTGGFPEIITEAYVFLKGKPVIRRQPTHFGMLGDNVRLDCNIFSIPTPDKITWSFGGREIGLDSEEGFQVQIESKIDGIKSTLIIHDARSDQFGTYNCTAHNRYGSDSIEVALRPQSVLYFLSENFPILLVLVGILGGVVVVVTVILITILCQRKVKKLPPPPPAIVIDSEKQCKDSDRSSNISDIKLEIRTGSSASNQNCEDCNGGHDSDSVITRVGPLSNSYSINRFSTSTDYPDPVFPPKSDGQNNNGYVPYVDYTKDYNPPPSSLHSSLNTSPSLTTSNFHASSLDTRFSATYGNPYLRSTNSPTLPTLPNGQPPPPPYCTLRNGGLPQLSRFNHSPTSQYIVANNTQQAIVKKGSLATHV